MKRLCFLSELSALLYAFNGNDFLKNRENAVADCKVNVQISEKPFFKSDLTLKTFEKIVDGVCGAVAPDFMLIGCRGFVGNNIIDFAVYAFKVVDCMHHFFFGGKLSFTPCAGVHNLLEVGTDSSAEGEYELTLDVIYFSAHKVIDVICNLVRMTAFVLNAGGAFDILFCALIFRTDSGSL